MLHLFFSLALAAKSVDSKLDWAGLPWGSPKPENCVVVERDRDSVFCSRGANEPPIGDIEASITLMYWRDQLAGVMLLLPERTKRRALEALAATYGEGHQPNQFIEDYFWFGDKIVIGYDDKVDGAIVLYQYRPLFAEKSLADEAAAKQTGGAL